MHTFSRSGSGGAPGSAPAPRVTSMFSRSRQRGAPCCRCGGEAALVGRKPRRCLDGRPRSLSPVTRAAVRGWRSAGSSGALSLFVAPAVVRDLSLVTGLVPFWRARASDVLNQTTRRSVSIARADGASARSPPRSACHRSSQASVVIDRRRACSVSQKAFLRGALGFSSYNANWCRQNHFHFIPSREVLCRMRIAPCRAPFCWACQRGHGRRRGLGQRGGRVGFRNTLTRRRPTAGDQGGQRERRRRRRRPSSSRCRTRQLHHGGLSYGGTGRIGPDIDFAIYPQAGGALFVYEAG